ncbi:MAG: hypothetical protein HUN04_00445 [Desulfobacter sp.]|nr:MAG: hypothetical protein HUN04_00445 [Desulfobacter sp.]
MVSSGLGQICPKNPSVVFAVNFNRARFRGFCFSNGDVAELPLNDRLDKKN